MDELYQGAEKLGYEILDVTIDGDTATLVVSPIVGRTAETHDKLARMGTTTWGWPMLLSPLLTPRWLPASATRATSRRSNPRSRSQIAFSPI